MSLKIEGKTGKGLIEYCKAQVSLPYWCGTFGQIATKALYEYNKSRLPGYYTANDFETQFGKRVHDCVGLIKGYMWSETPTSSPVYNPSQDVTVEKMYSLGDNKGSIKNIPIKDGILLFNSSLSHVAVLSADKFVYQAAGHAYGVTKSVFNANDWCYWSECAYISYEENKEISTVFDTNDFKELAYGKIDNAVAVWQVIVGENPDGIFGSKTKQATIKYQKIWFPNEPIEWDGIVGPKTWCKGLQLLKK